MLKFTQIFFYITILTCFDINGVFAQLHISTNMRKDYSWNESKSEWVLESIDKESSTFFDFNKDETMFTHTTKDLKSSYVIKSEDHEKDTEIWTFEIVSDVGNKYTMILDLTPDFKNIRFAGIDKETGRSFLVRHSIKAIWTE